MHIPRSFFDELEKIAERKLTDREKELFNKLKKESPVEVRKTDDAHEFGGGYFDPTGFFDKDHKPHIGVTEKRFDTLAHEIGHAENHKTLWGKLVQSIPSRLAFMLAPTAGVIAGISLAKGKKWPLVIPAAAVAPVLVAEAMATHTGKNALERVGADEKEVAKYRQNLRSAFATYLRTPAATAVLGTLGYLVQKAVKAP